MPLGAGSMPLGGGRGANDAASSAGTCCWTERRVASLAGAGGGIAPDADAGAASERAEPSAAPGGLTTSAGKAPVHAASTSRLPLNGTTAALGGREGGDEGAGKPVALGAS